MDSLAMPAPRTSLTIGSGIAATRSFGLPGLYEILQRQYRKVLARLQDEGKIDEAAFVLAELLRDPAGAVALLERHKRYLQAARLADASGLEVPVRIRTWMLAGDLSRAVRIARREGGMSNAIAMLKRTHPPAAEALAVAWASARAEAGDYVEAVTIALDVASAASLVRAWIELAIDTGGAPAARMLARRATLSPDRWENTRARALALLDDDATETTGERLAFAKALVDETPTDAIRVLARAAARTAMRDAHTDTRTLDRLLTLASSSALRTDRVRNLVPTNADALDARATPIVIHVDAREVGSVAVHDAALLPSGRLVLALGEIGVRVVTRDGRRVHAHDVPAHALVVSDTGTRALAIARAGSLHRIARVDLVGGRSERWWEAMLDGFTRTFDGSTWLVIERGAPTTIDVLDTGWSSIVRLDLPAVFVDRSVSFDEASVLITGGEIEWLRYDPSLKRLRKRQTLATPSTLVRRIAMQGECWITSTGAENDTTLGLVTRDAITSLPLPGPMADGTGLAVGGTHVATASQMTGGVRVDLRSANGRELAHILLDGASTVSLRLSSAALVIADDRGRVMALDPQTGTLLRDLRVRA